MTNRRELADRLEGGASGAFHPQMVADLREAARLLREPVAGEVEAVKLLRQFHTRIMMERRCGGLGVNVAQPIMEATEALLSKYKDC